MRRMKYTPGEEAAPAVREAARRQRYRSKTGKRRHERGTSGKTSLQGGGAGPQQGISASQTIPSRGSNPLKASFNRFLVAVREIAEEYLEAVRSREYQVMPDEDGSKAIKRDMRSSGKTCQGFQEQEAEKENLFKASWSLSRKSLGMASSAEEANKSSPSSRPLQQKFKGDLGSYTPIWANEVWRTLPALVVLFYDLLHPY
jgi:hypothetical protein